VPHPLRMMVAARIPIKDFFMFISYNYYVGQIVL